MSHVAYYVSNTRGYTEGFVKALYNKINMWIFGIYT